MDKPRVITSYDYDPVTGEYLSEGVAEYEFSTDSYILAPNSTFVKPPEDAPEFTVPCFNEKTGEWELRFDYRRKAVGDHYEGGKPYYNPENLWWAVEQYMDKIGDIPKGMSFNKIERPAICQTILDIEGEIADAKRYLSDTDYVHNVILEEPEKEEYYAPVIAERKRIRATIDPKQAQVDALKNEVADTYGEEALNHLWR